MMTKDNMHTLPELALTNIDYAFFTNENGHSDAGCLIHDQKTRNVNIFSSGQRADKGFDPADRVLDNIQMCIHELSMRKLQPNYSRPCLAPKDNNLGSYYKT
ncbi:MAG: hypothetical protein P1U74_05700 [Legionellaceae bacterium]|nr:hypothetical protein [Legionellaceae bacterium]